MVQQNGRIQRPIQCHHHDHTMAASVEPKQRQRWDPIWARNEDLRRVKQLHHIHKPHGRCNTSYFTGESATQTFTFYFEIPTAHTVVYSPSYIGVSANSWVQENYDY